MSPIPTIQRVWSAMTTGVRAFRYALSPEPQGGLGKGQAYNAWDQYNVRRDRYSFLWRMYENSAIGDVWGDPQYQIQFKLYEHARHIYNPSYRLGEFYATHLMGGALDPNAGDGESKPSSLPIVTDDSRLRAPIARLWRDSGWGVQKDVYCRFGAVLGDVGLLVRSDADEQKMFIDVIHPGSIVWLRRACRNGRITGYQIEEYRYAPGDGNAPAPASINAVPVNYPQVLYTERAIEIEPGRVRIETFMDGVPHDWTGNGPKWDADLPAVPLVMVQHKSFNRDFGISCLQEGFSRFMEVDDQASILSDSNRRRMRAPKLIAGVAKPAPNNAAASDRDQLDNLYASDGVGVNVFDLSPSVDIAGICAHIAAMNADIANNFPELTADSAASTADASGRAVREARKRCASKIQARRTAYDDGLVEAQKLAIAIGGELGFPGYEGFGFDSLKDGSLEHRIGTRQVFENDPMDEMDLEKASLANYATGVQNGMSQEAAMAKYLNWSPDEIKAEMERQKQAAALVAATVSGNVSTGTPAKPIDKAKQLESSMHADSEKAADQAAKSA